MISISKYGQNVDLSKIVGLNGKKTFSLDGLEAGKTLVIKIEAGIKFVTSVVDEDLKVVFKDSKGNVFELILKNMVSLLAQNDGEKLVEIIQEGDNKTLASITDLVSALEAAAAGGNTPNTPTPANGNSDSAANPYGISDNQNDVNFRSTTTRVDAERSTADTTTFNIRINSAPVVTVNSTATVAEDGSTTISFVSSDIDADTLVSNVIALNGVVTVLNGVITYSPNANFNGSDTITLTVNDGTITTVKTINVTVNPVNDAPVVTVNSTATVAEDGSTTISFVSSDIDADTLVSNVIALNGVVTVLNGVITYSPNANFNGSDTITLTVNDGTITTVKTINVTVNPVNDAPVVTVNSTATVAEDGSTTISFVSSDIDADTLTPSATAANGTVTIDGSVITYSPNANFNGSDTITLTVNDGTITTVRTINVTVNPVNDAPVVTVNSTATVAEDGSTTISFVSSDIDADTLVSNVIALNGVVTVLNGVITYSPNANFNGSDTITLTVNDGTITTVKTINVTVNPVNDAPVVTVNSTATVAEDGSTTISFVSSDIDADTLTPSATAANGTVTIDGSVITYSPNANFNGSDTITLTVNDGTITTVRTINVTVNPVNDAPVVTVNSTATVAEDGSTTISFVSSDIDADTLVSNVIALNGVVTVLNGVITYSPNANFNGSDTITLTVNDGTITTVKTINVTVNPVNDAPVVTVNSTATVAEDGSTTISFVSSDIDADTLVSNVIALNGVVTVLNGVITYSPNANFNGSDTITLTVNDGTITTVKTINVTVNPVNDAPVAIQDFSGLNIDSINLNPTTGSAIKFQFETSSVNEMISLDWIFSSYDYVPFDDFAFYQLDNQSLVLITSVDNEGFSNDSLLETSSLNTLKISVSEIGIHTLIIGVSNSSDKGVESYINILNIPDNFTIIDEIGNTSNVGSNYQISSSGSSDLAEFIYLVTENKSVTIDVLSNDTDIDVNDILTITAASVNSGFGSVSIVNNKLLFNPGSDFDYLGVNETVTVNVNYTISDGNGGVSSSVASVKITGTNDSPIITSSNNSQEGTELSDINVITSTSAGYAYFTVTETTTLTISTDGPTIDPILHLFKNDGVLDVIDLVATDDDSGTPAGDYNNSVITITLAPGNYVAIVGDYYLSVDEAVSGVISNDSIGTVSINFSSDKAIILQNTNAITSVYETQGDSNTTITSNLEIATDKDLSDTLTYSLVSGTVTVGGVSVADSLVSISFNQITGLWEYKIVGDFNYLSVNEQTLISFQYVANDGKGFNGTDGLNESSISEPKTVSVALIGTNDAPVVTVNPTATVAEDGSTTISFVSSDIDADTLTPSATAANGTVTIDGSVITYSPNANFNGSDTITLTVNDGTTTTVKTINVTVNPLNDAPTVTSTNITVSETALTDATPEILQTVVADVDGKINLTISTTNSTIIALFNQYNVDGYISRIEDAIKSLLPSNISNTLENNISYVINDTNTSITITVETNFPSNPFYSVISQQNLNKVLLDHLGSAFNLPLEDAVYSGQIVVADVDNLSDVKLSLGDVKLTVTTSNKYIVSLWEEIKNYSLSDINQSSLTDINYIRNLVSDFVNGVQANSSSSTTIEIPSTVVALLEKAGLFNIVLQNDGTYKIVSALFNTMKETDTIKVEFDYVANDGLVDSNKGTTTVTITGSNDAPVAFADAVTYEVGTSTYDGALPGSYNINMIKNIYNSIDLSNGVTGIVDINEVMTTVKDSVDINIDLSSTQKTAIINGLSALILDKATSGQISALPTIIKTQIETALGDLTGTSELQLEASINTFVTSVMTGTTVNTALTSFGTAIMGLYSTKLGMLQANIQSAVTSTVTTITNEQTLIYTKQSFIDTFAVANDGKPDITFNATLLQSALNKYLLSAKTPADEATFGTELSASINNLNQSELYALSQNPALMASPTISQSSKDLVTYLTSNILTLQQYITNLSNLAKADAVTDMTANQASIQALVISSMQTAIKTAIESNLGDATGTNDTLLQTTVNTFVNSYVVANGNVTAQNSALLTLQSDIIKIYVANPLTVELTPILNIVNAINIDPNSIDLSGITADSILNKVIAKLGITNLDTSILTPILQSSVTEVKNFVSDLTLSDLANNPDSISNTFKSLLDTMFNILDNSIDTIFSTDINGVSTTIDNAILMDAIEAVLAEEINTALSPTLQALTLQLKASGVSDTVLASLQTEISNYLVAQLTKDLNFDVETMKSAALANIFTQLGLDTELLEKDTRDIIAEQMVQDVYDRLSMDEDLQDIATLNYKIVNGSIITTIFDENGLDITSLFATANDTEVTIDSDGSYVVKNSLFDTLNALYDVKVEFDYVVNDGQVDSEPKTVTVTNEALDLDSNGELSFGNDDYINLGNVLENVSNNSFDTSNIDSVDLSTGDHILSNLTIEDFEAMVSEDTSNTLSIDGDSGDKIKLDLSTWSKDTTDLDSNTATDNTDDGYIAYKATGTTNQTLTLLIDKDITVENV